MMVNVKGFQVLVVKITGRFGQNLETLCKTGRSTLCFLPACVLRTWRVSRLDRNPMLYGSFFSWLFPSNNCGHEQQIGL